MKLDNPALILGMYETGLGVGRNLARKGIEVYGLDFKKDVAFYSKYIKSEICPHPINNENEFIEYIIQFSKKFDKKPVLFVTSDFFLSAVSANIEKIKKYYLINISSKSVINNIKNKSKQIELAKKIGIDVPQTYFPKKMKDVIDIKEKISYPAIIKAEEVNSWRQKISDEIKGFRVENSNQLIKKYEYLMNNKINAIVQEIIPGPDNQYYKYCAIITENHDFLLEFTLQKIRNYPVPFGVGSSIVSIEYPELVKIGRKLFKATNYQGVGSAEFKLDKRDGKLKLIELNPRYWQQISLPEKCGIDFPYCDYLNATNQVLEGKKTYKNNIKWINLYLDFRSFINRWKKDELSFYNWISSIKGKKIFSVNNKDDLFPVFYESGKIIKSVFKKIL